MKLLKENMYEIILLIGIVLISIGFFMLYIPLGFIVSGVLLVLCILIVWRAQQEGGD